MAYVLGAGAAGPRVRGTEVSIQSLRVTGLTGDLGTTLGVVEAQVSVVQSAAGGIGRLQGAADGRCEAVLSAGGLSAAVGQGPLLSHGEMSVQLLVIALRLLRLRFAHRLVAAFWVFSVRIARYRLTSARNADQSARQEADETRGSAARSLASRLRPRVAHVKPALLGGGETLVGTLVLGAAFRVIARDVLRPLHQAVGQGRLPAGAEENTPFGVVRLGLTLGLVAVGRGPNLSDGTDPHHGSQHVSVMAAWGVQSKSQGGPAAQRCQQHNDQRPARHRGASVGVSCRGEQ